MHLIKKCPSCGKNLRFPIDHGIIKVSCPCGNSFIADPDNPELYRNGTFDLKNRGRKKAEAVKTPREFSLKQIRHDLITRFMDMKYTLQNFRLLPSSRQRKIILEAAGIAVLLFIAVYFIIILLTRDSGKPIVI